MKIIDKTPGSANTGLRISETKPGTVYYYSFNKEYVLRTHATSGNPFASLRDGTMWSGTDLMLYPVEATLEVKR